MTESSVSRRIVARRISLDVGTSFASRCVIIVLHLIAGVLVARALGPTGKGALVLVAALVGYASSGISLGVDGAIVHFGAGKPEQLPVLISSALPIGAAAGSVGALGGILAFAHMSAGVPVASAPWAMGTLAVAPAVLMAVYLQSALVASGRIAEVAVFSVAKAGTWTLTIWGALHFASARLSAIFGGLALVELLNLVVLLVACRHASLILAAPARSAGRRLMVYGLKGYAGSLLQSINFRLDVLVIAAIADTTAVGQYSVAVTVAEMLWMVPMVLSFVIAQRAAGSNATAASVLTAQVTRLTSLLSASFAAIAALAGPAAIHWFFGERFSPAVVPMWLLLPGAWALSIYINLMNDLNGRGWPRVKSASALCGVLVTVPLDLMLIPRYGIRAAAAVSTLAYAVALVAGMIPYCRITGATPRQLLLPQARDVTDVMSAVGTLLHKSRL